MYRNLQINAHRLTTPFDIYATLVDILDFSERKNLRVSSSPRRSMSLLREISVDRTCDHAAVLPHWCTCHQQVSVDIQDPSVIGAVQATVDTIRYELQRHRDMCAHLEVDTILDARVMAANDNVLRFRESINDVIGRSVKYGSVSDASVNYLVTFRTRPGGGLFEATVRHSIQEADFPSGWRDKSYQPIWPSISMYRQPKT